MKNSSKWLMSNSSANDFEVSFPRYFYWDFPDLQDFFPLGEYNFFTDTDLQSALRNDEMDLVEQEDAYVMVAEIPGLTKNDVNLELKNNVLHISAKKKIVKDEQQGKIISKGCSFSSFKRSFVLGEEIDTDKVEASVKDGILCIRLPKLEKVSRKIEVK